MKLDLLIPYLLTPPAATADLPSCKLLETWLSRSVISHARPDYHSQLFSILNLPTETSPAFLSGLADGCDAAFMHWRADPVHFQARSDHALLRDSHSLNITADEAAQLVAAFNQHFAADGVQLFAATPQRWYLETQHLLNLKTTPITQAISRNVRHFLPTGQDQVLWRKILNETQMLFYAHAVNQQRESLGQLTVNSLWLWGEGCREWVKPVMSPILYANEIIAYGAAKFINTTRKTVDDWKQHPAAGLLVIDDLVMAASYGDAEEWMCEFDRLCQRTLPVVFNAMKSGKIKQINLYPADGRCFALTNRDFRKFWRGSKPVKYWMRHEN